MFHIYTHIQRQTYRHRHTQTDICIIIQISSFVFLKTNVLNCKCLSIFILIILDIYKKTFLDTKLVLEEAANKDFNGQGYSGVKIFRVASLTTNTSKTSLVWSTGAWVPNTGYLSFFLCQGLRQHGWMDKWSAMETDAGRVVIKTPATSATTFD